MSLLTPKSITDSESFFSENRKICDRFFEQQEKMLELALRQTSSSETAQILIQKARETSEKVISELLATQERGLQLLLKSELTSGLTPRGNSEEIATLSLSKASEISGKKKQTSSPNGAISVASSLAKQVEVRFLEEIARITGFPKETIQTQSRFDDLGLDSITLAEIWAEMMEKIPELEKNSQTLLRAQSIEDILRIISKKQKPKQTTQTEGSHLIEWSAIREDLVERFSKALDLAPETIQDTSDFEEDLKIDIFTREEILECVLQPYTALTNQLGRELLHAKNLAEIDLLIERFGGNSLKPLSPVTSLNTLETVERHLLAGRQDIPFRKTESLPDALVLIGKPGRNFDTFRKAFQKVGIRVFEYFITPSGWSVPEWQERPIPLDCVEALRDALALAKSPSSTPQHPPVTEGKLPAVVMLAMEEEFSPLESENQWQSKVEAATTALFVFAKAVAARRPSAAEGGFVAILGSHQMSPAWHGAKGVAKSASREWPGARIKSIWLDGAPTQYSDEQILQGIFESPNELDLEFDQNGLFKRKLITLPAIPSSASQSPVLHKDSNILILGGGDGISAEIGVKLAQTYQCRIIALGRTEWSDPLQNEADLKRLVQEDSNLANTEGFQQRWKQISRQKSFQTTHDRVCAAGGTFKYYSAEATEFESLQKTLDKIRKENGPLSGVIHGAGIIEDNLFTKKSVESFRRVLYTKSSSVFHLYNLVKRDPLQFVVLLSSLSSYTGSPGQTDYAAANEILNSVAHEWNKTASYPVKSMLWSVWNETGLVGPALRLQMARMGLKGISTEEGVRLFMEELTLGEKSQDWVLFAPNSTLKYAKTLARSEATENR